MKIISRSEWGAQYGIGSPVALPWPEVVVHTEAGAVRDQDWPAITEAAKVLSLTEKQHMRAIERYHAVVRGWGRYGYSFFLFRDGTICEGNGWGHKGAHTEGRNSTAMGLCFAGHGDLQKATEAQWASAWWLIREGIRLGHLKPKPLITGHRNYSTKGKTCPGNLIYPQLHRLRNLTTGGHPAPNPGDLDMDEKTLRRIVGEEIDKRINPDRKGNLLVRIRNGVATENTRSEEIVKGIRDLLKRA